MTLDILMPHYKESFDVVKPYLDSVALQGGINFDDVGVIIVNDGDDVVFDESLFAGYPFKITYLVKKHEGVSAARNYALDHSTADYVTFSDCDDMWLNLYGMHMVFSAMNERYDAITSLFIEEHKEPDGSYKIIRRDKDSTFVHGKIYRRKYLVDEKIRWRKELTIHEDGYFNCVALTCTDNKKEITTPFYIWKWRDGSAACKGDTKFVLRTYADMLKTRTAICKEVKKRGFVNEYYDFVCRTVIDSYYDFNKPEYLKPENAELVANAEKAFRKFYMKFRQDYNECNVQRIAEIMYLARGQAYVNGLRIEQRTITEWLTHIVKDVEE